MPNRTLVVVKCVMVWLFFSGSVFEFVYVVLWQEISALSATKHCLRPKSFQYYTQCPFQYLSVPQNWKNPFKLWIIQSLNGFSHTKFVISRLLSQELAPIDFPHMHCFLSSFFALLPFVCAFSYLPVLRSKCFVLFEHGFTYLLSFDVDFTASKRFHQVPNEIMVCFLRLVLHFMWIPNWNWTLKVKI